MECLSDSLLLEAYQKAIELNLNKDFIKMIKEEIERRAELSYNKKH
ncbi:sporulation histidine kinase inhibitor Sda [Pseudogracilibacillus sp. SO30301A]